MDSNLDYAYSLNKSLSGLLRETKEVEEEAKRQAGRVLSNFTLTRGSEGAYNHIFFKGEGDGDG